MNLSDLEIIPYTSKYEELWDRFVMENSVNGTFLQTRRFLNYHPQNRFKDASMLIMNSGNLIAACPANVVLDKGKKILYSHQGATFGGLVIDKKHYSSEKMLEIIDALDGYLKKERYDKSILKLTPDLYAQRSGNLIEYCLQNRGYHSFCELNTYVNLTILPDDVMQVFDRNKKRNIEKCKKYNLQFRLLEEEKEIIGFHQLLTINLQKYNLKPIHTVNEVLEFKNKILCDKVKFYGVFQDDNLLAAGMMFVFEQVNLIHAQNLSADYHFQEYSPITYLYYKIIEQAKKDGYNKLSWGISTEKQGSYLNQSLVRNKESYGSEYALNWTFYKEYPK